MSKGKLGKWVNDNIVMLVGVPLIIGIHYGWAKIQDVPYLVDPSEKRGQPIIEAFKTLKRKMIEKLYLEGRSTNEPQEK